MKLPRFRLTVIVEASVVGTCLEVPQTALRTVQSATLPGGYWPYGADRRNYHAFGPAEVRPA
jgi:hypothetical protein